MKRVQILFDDDPNDVDIIEIPNYMYMSIHELTQQYLHWKPPLDDENGWTVVDGRKTLLKETAGFVEWLTQYHCRADDKVRIIAQHVVYCADLKCVEF